MSTGERLAVAAHLHVLLRRRTGRVTDPEWMATNREYATAIVAFARAKALELQAEDLRVWATKLESVMGQPLAKAHVPLVQAAAAAFRQSRPGQERELPSAPEVAGDLASQASDLVGLDSVGPSSQFTETGFGESVINGRRVSKKGADEPRYVGGLR
jgi:hypothetical protein